MVGVNPLHLCAWHLIHVIIYRTNLQTKQNVASEPEWVPDIIATIHRRTKLPFQIISTMFVYRSDEIEDMLFSIVSHSMFLAHDPNDHL